MDEAASLAITFYGNAMIEETSTDFPRSRIRLDRHIGVRGGGAVELEVRFSMEALMRLIAVHFLMAAAGCGRSTTAPSNRDEKDTPEHMLPSIENQSEHDYLGWIPYAPIEARFEVRFPKVPILKTASPATGNFHVAGVQRQTVNDLAFGCRWLIKENAFRSTQAEAAYLKGQQIGTLD
jgi:hypothetical protein